MEEFEGSVEWPEVIPVDVQVQATSLYVTQPLGVAGLTTISSKPESIKEYEAAMDPGRWQLLALVELLPLNKLKKKFSILVQKLTTVESRSDGGLLSAGIATMGCVVTDGREVRARDRFGSS